MSNWEGERPTKHYTHVAQLTASGGYEHHLHATAKKAWVDYTISGDFCNIKSGHRWSIAKLYNVNSNILLQLFFNDYPV